MVKTCSFCEGQPQYRDRRTGHYLCLEHARLEVVAPAEQSFPTGQLAIRAVPAVSGQNRGGAVSAQIEALALYFWDETDVDCFDRCYDVLACPAFVACDGSEVVGAASCALEADWDALVLVMLDVLPAYQGRGAGRALLDAVRDEAARRGLGRVLVATSNDDLPALALYQRYGFRITEVMPGGIARHHGGDLPGFAGIPIRDEIRLEYQIGGA
jgi:ribosomal protein S18 acetylase RimI-like enzyme